MHAVGMIEQTQQESEQALAELEVDPVVLDAAALLDERKPGWDELVDTDKLVMMSKADCILGQVYGDWQTGLEQLGISGGGIGHPLGAAFATRASSWKALIASRR